MASTTTQTNGRATVAEVPAKAAGRGAPAPGSRLAEAFEADPTLTNYWLVVEADSAQIVFGDYPTDGALFIDLSACVSYVREHGEGAA